MKNIKRAVRLSRKQSEWFLSNSISSVSASFDQKITKEFLENEEQKYKYRKISRD